MRVYYFTCARWALDNVAKRRIKVSRIDQLNDPFEFLSPALKLPDDRAIFRDWKATLARRWGIICFSASWRNPVQWSHYGDRHRGCCLGIDVPDNLLRRVLYVSKRERVENLRVFADKEELDEKFMTRALSTKFAHWRYEKEFRVFVDLESAVRDGEHYFQWLHDQATLQLREFIVGPGCAVTRDEVAHALGDLAAMVQVHKARLAFQTFSVTRQRRDDLWNTEEGLFRED